ncbi:acetoin dehydrogenase dihydrolipoyllysine-residue acetyltransferase subunit [Paracoccus versutus]|uniref:Pyruvate dehydrogenase E2 component (Dihydrolipoamide acetyltransferase) n=1 Tax=Paracoccus versutus TaxID=34007 RepID=A0A3D9XT35_PARVE|nr:acetoin dehydrogenase dihydrolipoyllysine-residue acetyltransferase subunit [Paracoccus versutus]REF73249.1 pyruvate dehydrogenase E2 component (dihydrolipoamide acetyltransferase) [Paracoccus versutus]REF73600.1 pyruvate dehydrogenase E2 component (dihydrolipoamide acetyltransferase) [Paracoccus versutus]WGR54856.1 acetoin dehydrogenase dihydrolipoyllysine-residue acetyltransferase subunit [Paracoccus versutus]
MPTEVILPKVDMDMATGRISRWLVEDGASVEKGAALFEIETDKAAMEIDSPASGTLQITEPDTGKEISVGEPVAWIYAEGEAPIEKPASSSHTAARSEAETPTSVPKTEAPRKPLAPSAADGLRATPLARRLARENGLDLATVNGSGPRGRIQRADIEAALNALPAAPTPAPMPTAAAQQAKPQCKPQPAPKVSSGPLNAVWLRQGTGTPVVLIHGFGAELDSWRPLLPEIPADRPIFALDLPGHGKSLGSEVASFDDLVIQVEETLAESGIGAAHLVGHSLGGAVAASIASGIRIEAASLLLISPAGLGPEISSFVENFARATHPGAVASWLRELVHDPATLTDSFIRTVARGREDGRLAEAQTRFAAAVFGGGAQGFSIRSALAQLGCQVRIIFGIEDRVIPWRQAFGLPGTVALHLLQQTGHMPQLEQRETVGRILRQIYD